MGNLSEVDAGQMINKSPVNISAQASLGEMLTKIDSLSFIILFLPVVDEKGILQGAVLLNNLTRG
jgi:Mg/Co/Ni transporter MgtE